MTQVLVLRTCLPDLTSYRGFQWPSSGFVEAPDWDPAPVLGCGLHGLLWGEGESWLLRWGEGDRWLVVAVDGATVVDLGGKVKFPRGEVVYCGDQSGATSYIDQHGGAGRRINGLRKEVGDYQTAIVGDYGVAIASIAGYALAQHRGHATAGENGLAVVSEYGTAIVGDFGRAIAGCDGRAIAGDLATAIAGDRGYAEAGRQGYASAGLEGDALVGDFGTALAGPYGQVMGGKGATLHRQYYNGAGQIRMATAYVGENGILPNRFYRCMGGEFFEVT